MILVSCFAAVALAQEGADAHHFSPVPGNGGVLDLLSTWQPTEWHPGTFGGSALFEYANDAGVAVSEDFDGTRTTTPLLDDVFVLDAGFVYAPSSRVAITVAAPVFLASRGADGPQGAGIGDVRLAVPVGLLRGGFGLSLVPFLDAPTGDEELMRGNGGVSFGGLAAGGVRRERFTVDGNLGYKQTPAITWQNLNGGGHLLAALGAGVALTDELGLRVEGLYDGELSKNDIPLTAAPAEGLASLRGRYANGLSWTAGGATAISRGFGAPAYRAFVGVGYARGEATAERADRDADGLIDQVDACPIEPETTNAYADEDGCPDALATLALVVVDDEGTPVRGTVTIDGQPHTLDESGRLRVEDLVPGAVVGGIEAPGYQGATLGGPLVEGENTRTLTMAWLPGSTRIVAQDEAGAPVDATIAFQGPSAVDGVELGPTGRKVVVLPEGDWQVVATAEGLGAETRAVRSRADQAELEIAEFALRTPQVTVAPEEIRLDEQIPFDTGSNVIRPDAEPLLRQVAGVLASHPEIGTIELQGYCDDVGPAAFNLDLSQKRVDAVRDWLIAHGIAADRIVARGYGEDRPIAPNDSPEGRAQNRRAQFVILR